MMLFAWLHSYIMGIFSVYAHDVQKMLIKLAWKIFIVIVI